MTSLPDGTMFSCGQLSSTAQNAEDNSDLPRGAESAQRYFETEYR